MKQNKLVFFITIALLSLFSRASAARTNEPVKEKIKKELPPISPKQAALEKLKKQADFVYSKIDFSQCEEKLDKQVFTTAYIGYRNLRAADSTLQNADILTIGDYTMSANRARLWIINVKEKKVLYNTLVAHGQGTGEEFATHFSNIENSHQSSMGFYITADTYIGRNGYSLRLVGKDNGYNCRAMERAIVIHGAPYVTKQFIQENKRLGRSWGCPALPPEKATAMINTIKEGSILYIHANDKQYLAKTQWVNQLNESFLTPQQSTRQMAHHADSTARPATEISNNQL